MESTPSSKGGHIDAPVSEAAAKNHPINTRKLLARLQMRLRLYESSSRGQRIVSVWRALLAGAYRKETRMGFGLKQLLLDALYVVAP